MNQSVSAYLSIFNDWDILSDALNSISPYIDELVVVDGAYTWMAAYFEAIGIDPRRSDPRVRAAVEACGVPVRVIEGIWRTEAEKRTAGYEACAHRFVFRIDADELLIIHEDNLARFLAAGAAVAEMEMPIYAAPGLIRVNGPDAKLERQCLLFDKRQVTAAMHVHLLWLLTGPDKLPSLSEAKPPYFPDPIAFNNHLTGWRTPATAAFRAAFYTFIYTRENGMPWTGWVRGEPVRDLTVLLNELAAPAVYRDLLLTGPIVVGETEATATSLRPVPFGTPDDPRMVRLHGRFLTSLAALNRETAAAGRHFVNGDYVLFDLTTEAAAAALATGTTVNLAISSQPVNAAIQLYHELTQPPWHELQDVPYELSGNHVVLHLPEPLPSDAFIRSILRLRLWCEPSGPIHRLTVVIP